MSFIGNKPTKTLEEMWAECGITDENFSMRKLLELSDENKAKLSHYSCQVYEWTNRKYKM